VEARLRTVHREYDGGRSSRGTIQRKENSTPAENRVLHIDTQATSLPKMFKTTVNGYFISKGGAC